MANPLYSMATNQPDVGPLGGFLAARQDQMAEQRELQEQDILGQRAEGMRMDIEKARLNQPLDAIKRAEDLAKSEFELEQFRSGAKQKRSDAETDKVIQEGLKAKSDRERAEIKMKAEAHVAASQMFTDGDVGTPLQEPKWGQMVDSLEQAGVKNVPRVYSQQAHAQLKGMAQAGVITADHIRKLEEEKLKAINEGTKSARDAAERIELQKLQNAGSFANTKYAADAATARSAATSAARASNQKLTPANIVASIQSRWIADPSYVLNEREAAILEGYLMNQATGALDKTIEGKLLALQSTSSDPAEKAEALKAIAGAVQARMGKTGALVKPQATETPAPAAKPSKAAIDAELKRRGLK